MLIVLQFYIIINYVKIFLKNFKIIVDKLKIMVYNVLKKIVKESVYMFTLDKKQEMQRFTVVMDKEHINMLDELAKKYGITKSEVFRQLLEKFYKEDIGGENE